MQYLPIRQLQAIVCNLSLNPKIYNENMYSVSNNDKCNNPYSRSSLVCMFKDNVCDMNVCAGCCILYTCVRKHFYNNLHHHIMIPKSCFCHT